MTERTHPPLVRDADYLNLLTRKLFHSGFNKTLVDARWPGFEEAFCGFDPNVVARFNEDDIARLRSNAKIVRHRLKIRATVLNARHFVAMATEHGSWRNWLAFLRSRTYRERERALHSALTHCGPNTIFYFLLAAGETTMADRPDGVR